MMDLLNLADALPCHRSRSYFTINSAQARRWVCRMNKLSITLPAGGQICIESDDAGLVREVLYSFMPQFTGANGVAADASTIKSVDLPAHTNGHSASNGSAQHVAEPPRAPIVTVESNGAPPVAPAATVVQVAPPPPAPAFSQNSEAVSSPAVAAETMTPSEHEYIAFCQRVNPLGDMRRVVVAAEAAHRYLNITSVDPDGLEHLFTLAGWSIPHSFVQTLRNAARTKFRWLERIPGLSGHYKVTNTGRSIVLGESEIKTEAE